MKSSNHELTDEEMAVPGSKVSNGQLEAWLAKDDGEGYDIEDAFDYIKRELAKCRNS